MTENPVLKEAVKPQLYTLPLGSDIPLIALPPDFSVASAEPYLESFLKLQPTPPRRTGVYGAATVPSLIDWLKENAGETAPVFGAGLERVGDEWRTPELSLIGIGNYSNGAAAEWHDFRCKYAFPVSRQWHVWAGKSADEDHECWFTQSEFAEFMEDHIYEVSERGADEPVNEAVNRFLEVSKGEAFASVSDLLRLSREYKVRVDSETEVAFNPATGERVMRYNENHKGPGGRDVRIPTMFFIRIPVFFGQPETLIGVKLRYRTGAGGVAWSYSLFAPDLIVADEFIKACRTVETAGFRVYLGSPDYPQI